ncbi:transcriptional regulator [Plantactinospora sp. BC1]|uniref:AfsR/SARP family transcriptional regulator n=1 Tax=Plantactinospora sp. BC1 TaxID=2108470 RepID=UPI000D17596D|nr:BTAD domain-containing putative transcriptional regulator [Plantactinospora sp. BC1]AVT31036.1 transcriptional regulator [Plantactinospora sp. BC1]
MIEIRLLGPMQLLVGGSSLPLGTPKQQTVLALLAIRPGRIVTLEELIDELWPDAAPASAVANTRSYAARLRRAFDEVDGTRGLLARSGPGYEFRIRPDDVDLLAFEDECQRAGEALARADAFGAEDLIRRAEDRWRGPMLAGVQLGPVLSARRTAVATLRLGLIEQRAELHMTAGRPRLAIGMLREHLRAHPLRERGHALLIRALYEDGDVPGALAAFAAARAELVDQLGIEPGDELQQLHKAVLNRDPALGRPRVTVAGPQPGPPSKPGPPAGPLDFPDQQVAVPSCWLPRPVVDFTGRTEAIRRLTEAVERAEPGGPVIRVINGMAGIGKTALAVHLASRLTDHYPDAQLFIDLQGHSSVSPMQPSAALTTLLRQLGVPAGRISTELDQRIALWRSELATRRVIVLLDNAGSRAQVEPLLPSAPGTLVLVTSRRRLLGTDGIIPESLPVLAPDEAVDLLARTAGADRIRAEPEAAAAVVRQCGHLPLAIRLAGARLAHRPGWRVADLADRIDRSSRTLGELSAEDRSIAAAFDLSYQPLREPVRRMFRLLGLYLGEFFHITTAAALTGLPLPDAKLALAELVDHHLVEELSADRFRLHDLTRQYAADLAVATDAADEREAALGQLLDHYLFAAAVVSERLELPYHRILRLSHGPQRPELVEAVAPDTSWMERERGNIRSLIRLAAEGAHAHYAWQLARYTWRFNYTRGYSEEIIETHRVGSAAAIRLGDVAATATMHNYIASAYLNITDYQTAMRHLQRSACLSSSLGDVLAARASEANRAVVLTRMGRLAEAVEIYRRVRRAGLLSVGTNMGIPLMLLGMCEEALRVQRTSLFLAIELKKSFAIAQDLGNLGAIRLRMGQFSQAARLISASLALRARIRNRRGEPGAINDLGSAYRHLGRLDDALQLHRRAIAAAVDAGERDVESAALNDLGLTLSAAGRAEQAFEVHRQALELATRISHPYEQGRALAAMAAHREPQDPAEARRHWERALAIFGKMGVPERFEVERELARLALPVER